MPDGKATGAADSAEAVGPAFFDTERPAGLHERIHTSLMHAIISGQLAKGDKLPSEPVLANTFGVSRPVVRQALEKLRAGGMIQSLRGSGNYVASLDHLVASFQEIVADWTPHAKGMLDDLEFRLTVEPEAAYWAARRRGPNDLNSLRFALGQFEDAHAAGRITHHYDFRFHEAVAIATANARFVEAARMIEFPKDAERLFMRHITFFHPQRRGSEFIREHRRVLELITEREAEPAREAMRCHIIASRDRLTEQLRTLGGSFR